MCHFQVFYNLKDTSFNDWFLLKNLNVSLENEGRIVPTRPSAEQRTTSLIELQKPAAATSSNPPVVNKFNSCYELEE